MTIADDERRTALMRLTTALTDIAEMEGRMETAFALMAKTQAQQAEAARRHLSELWNELKLKDKLRELYEIKAVLEK